MIADRIRNLAWEKDRLILNDIVFRLEHFKDESWDLADDCFSLYRTAYLMDEYAKFFALQSGFHPKRVLELGMWDWGSGAFWLECLQPDKYVGIDLARKQPTDYLKKYVEKRGCADRFKAYWETDQTDAQALREIVADEFSEPIDVIIDDASHRYDASKRSFEILLPYLRPGGFYIIEDWAWAHWPAFEPDNPELSPTGLTPLITELVEMIGTSNSVLANASIYTGFAAFRTAEGNAVPAPFTVDQWIFRRKPIGPGSAPAPENGPATAADGGPALRPDPAAGGRGGRRREPRARRLVQSIVDRIRKPPR